MFRFTRVVVSLCLLLAFALPAKAHFGMLIPSESMLAAPDKFVSLTLSFSHPFEGEGMDLVKPAEFGVLGEGAKTDLLATLTPVQVMDHNGWQAEYTFARPGAHIFYMIPKPYWEPAEDVFIVHMTKTVVAAFGGEEGWGEPLGLSTEIVPLTRPFGNYAGNVFQGVVLVDGKPAPFAEVEVEYYNARGMYASPSEYMITQVVKADAAGTFTFACPWPGWWGFAALSEAGYTLKHDGQEKGVELGAVLWIEMVAPKMK